MLQICPKCHSAFYPNKGCQNCIRDEYIYPEKILGTEDWFEADFNDLSLCTEGVSSACEVVSKDGESSYKREQQYNYTVGLEKKEYTFKLALDTRRNPKIVICQSSSINFNFKLIRKPYIAVVFKEDSEEKYISLDTFRSHESNAYNMSTRENKEMYSPSLFGSWLTYESMFNVLEENKYKFYSLVCERRFVEGFELGEKLYITD